MANELIGTERRFEVDSRPTEELVSLATAAGERGGRVVFRGLSGRRLCDLLKIATAGGRWEGRLSLE